VRQSEVLTLAGLEKEKEKVLRVSGGQIACLE